MRNRSGCLGTFLTLVLVVFAAGSAFVALNPQVLAASRGTTRQTVITNRVTVSKGSVVLTVLATGSLAALQQSNLAFDANGTVRSISVQPGQQVSAGQVLATVDDSSQQAAVQQAQLNLQAAQSALDKVLQPIDPNTLAIAQASVKSAEGAYQSKAAGGANASDIAAAQAKVAQAQADQQYAVQQMKDAGGRYKTTDPNYQLAAAQAGQASFNLVVAQLNLQSLQVSSSLASASANIAVAEAKLAQVEAGPAQSDIDQAQANVLSAQTQLDQAKHALAKTQLVAPYAGVITQINIKQNEPSQSPAMVITDLSHLYAKINIDETDVTRLQTGQNVSLTVDALPGVTITGTVARIYPVADVTASVITYPVLVIVNPGDQPIKPGMTVNATFEVQRADNVLRVPNNYLRANATTGQTTVNLVLPDGTTVIPVPVKLGIAGTDYTEIIQGLSDGDSIALVAQQ